MITPATSHPLAPTDEELYRDAMSTVTPEALERMDRLMSRIKTRWPVGSGFRVLELFAGSRSIGKEAEKQGHSVISLDIEPFAGIHLVQSILDFHLDQLDLPPHFIWASVPCTSYSMLAIRHHRRGTLAISDTARLGDAIVVKTLDLIREAGCLWAIENPRAALRKMPFMQGLDRRTVMYCRYGDTRMKPTDLWGNIFYSLINPDGYQPRRICWNNNTKCHHERSPRYATLKAKGDKRTGGTVMMGNAYERSKLPTELCADLIRSAAEQARRKGMWG